MESLALRKSEFETNSEGADQEVAKKILNLLLQYRRTHSAHSDCDSDCPGCQAPHLPQILQAVQTQSPVILVLPAFPGKSPNLAKVLSPLPDLAELLALQFLENLCRRIQHLHAPGVQLILCADGRVFSDIVGIRESDVTDYQNELDQMIRDLGLRFIKTFHLDRVGGNQDFAQMRTELMNNFGAPPESLREKVLRGSKLFASPADQEVQRMYCGITRFLVEDSSFPGQSKSRTAIQKECKAKAYEVILRSNAWSELVARRFPEAVRLSIHPQTCGSKKLGIRLVGTETWMTPRHGVALKRNGQFTLVKRQEAEAAGARLILRPDGRPSHFEEQGNANEL